MPNPSGTSPFSPPTAAHHPTQKPNDLNDKDSEPAAHHLTQELHDLNDEDSSRSRGGLC
jgi:hypothetical protein